MPARHMHTAKIAFSNMKNGALCVVGYGFDNEWAIVPGVWTAQIWYQDHMLASEALRLARWNDEALLRSNS